MTDPLEQPPSPTPLRRQAGLRRIVSRFRRAQEGAAAIEFGIIALPFFMLMAAIIETALMLWTAQILEEALQETSRSLLTGTSQDLYKGSASDKTNAFRLAVCAKGSGMISCDDNKLFIDVRSYASFGAAQSGSAASAPVSGGALNTAGYGYNQPQPQQIVVVRAVLDYPLFFTAWSSALANIGTGKRGIVASTTFRTEPFVAPTT